VLDIVRLCTERHIPFLTSGHHHCRPGWVQLHCPNCTGGKSGYHLGFSLELGYFNCWRCGKIKITEAVAGLLHILRPGDVVEVLRQYQRHGPGPVARASHRPASLAPPPELAPLSRAHRAYLRGRGLSPSHLVRLWGLRGTTFLSGAWNWRVVYPICDMSGRTVAWQGRAIHTGVEPRYKTTDTNLILIDPRAMIYGIHCIPSDAVVIVEGAVDVWRLGPGAVASLGIGWKHQQIEQLRAFNRRYVMFDPEPAAQRRACEVAAHLGQFRGTTEIIDGLSSDPGDMAQAEADRIMAALGIRGGQ